MPRMWFTPAKVEPGVDVSDADAAVGEVKDGKFFYSVEAPRKEGTMPTETLAPGSGAYPAGYHAGNVGGLVAIDEHLVAGNIKKDVVIFGVTGTFESVLATTLLEATSAKTMQLDTVWDDTSFVSAEVPDTALRVEIVVCGSLPANGQSGDLRIVYNGVEKATVALSADGKVYAAYWEGEGLGSAALLGGEAKVDTGTDELWYGGGIYYQTFA